MQFLQRRLHYAAAVAVGVIACVSAAVIAGEGLQYGLRRCPGCGVCQSEAKIVKVKKTTFTVEREEVCVPPVQIPWLRCKPISCGFVKSVCVLKKGSKTVEECQYESSVEKCADYQSADAKSEKAAPGAPPVPSASTELEVTPIDDIFESSKSVIPN
ncbi:MAG: hypothetical protein WEB58_01210 [Planctomycetaceae bacterium]